jgi:GNAT superfamily N-acetyltransferase
MRTKTVSKLVRNLTSEEYDKCKSLNFRYNGCMRYDLPMARKNYPDKARVVMIKEADSGKLIAWCLAFPDSDSDNFLTQYYTRVAYRRQGYGARLVRQVSKHVGKPIVMPHDRRSRSFFRKHESQILVNNSYSLY